MTTPATDGKMLVNALYHSAVVSGLAAGYAWDLSPSCQTFACQAVAKETVRSPS